MVELAAIAVRPVAVMVVGPGNKESAVDLSEEPVAHLSRLSRNRNSRGVDTCSNRSGT